MGINSNSYGKEFRLKSRKDFLYLKSDSSHLYSKFCGFHFKPSRNLVKETRIGISISKKVGNSVLRNRFKRLIREIFRQSQYKFEGTDTLIVVSPSLTKKIILQNKREDILKREIEYLFKELSLRISENSSVDNLKPLVNSVKELNRSQN